MGAAKPLARFDAVLEVLIRPCRAEDLPLLEWFGAFAEHRQIIHEAFEAQAAGSGLMLAAVANGFPLGQVWIRFGPDASPDAALLWALRVFPAVQGLGLGRRLVAAAEQAAAERGFALAEIGVEKHNREALRLYLRLGYEPTGERRETFAYTSPRGAEVSATVDQWVLRKALAGEGLRGGPRPTRP